MTLSARIALKHATCGLPEHGSACQCGDYGTRTEGGTMTAQHTPVPWATTGRNISPDGSENPPLVTSGPYIIAKMGYIGPEAEANAAFIVRACNNHEELLQALRQIADPFGFPVSLTAEERRIQDSRLARAAIAKATQGG